MKTSLGREATRVIAARLEKANSAFARRFPGQTGRRQPVHTVYGGAHLFRADIACRLGSAARRALEKYAPDYAVFARAIGLLGDEKLPKRAQRVRARAGSEPQSLAQTIYSRVVAKLEREPVEDFRIDFEDGYGNRPDAEEDGHATVAAEEIARGMAENLLSPFVGIRIKSLNEELRERSLRTLDIFVSTLSEKTGGKLPKNFFITLPKVTIPHHVAALADVFDQLEPAAGLAPGSLHMELMIETTQSILNERGESTLPRLVDAARGRCVAAHFGTYDYTASCNITAAHQHMTHPACDFARQMMQVALGGTSIWLSDGSTNILPVPVHRAAEGGPPLTPRQVEENHAVVHRAWKLHYDHIQHSLINAFYQGWDLHPAQLPTRYAAVYAFFLEGLDAAAERLKNFVARAAQTTLVGEVFDDAATGQGLLNYFLRAINCGAVSEEETVSRTGLTWPELRSRSFVKILNSRTK